jgi:centromere/kinetochore protein ZW10
MLYRASRELLDLFRAIIPTVHASEVGSIPRVAAVLHNDCVYLAHESGLLGAEYKIKFRSLNLDNVDSSSNSSSSSSSSNSTPKSKTSLLGEICSFLDMIPPFRDLANKSMGAMIEKQKAQLYELVAPRLVSFQEALTSNESVTEWDDADTALRAALFHLRHLSQSWKLVLARNVYCMAMGNLVDMILILFLDPVLKSDAITEAASRFIHSLFFDAVRGVADFFVIESLEGSMKQTNSSNESFSGNDNNMQERSIQLTKKYSTLLAKTRAVGNLMVMRLDEIQRGLEEGAFCSVNARELSHLITAAFDNSEKRSILLNDLASR